MAIPPPPTALLNGIQRANALIYLSQHEVIRLWLAYDVFSWRWFVNLAIAIVPWVVWLKLRKKDSTFRVLSAGFAVIIVSCYLDFLGTKLGLWAYYSMLVPFSPPYLPWDFSVMPIGAMLLLQYKPNANRYLKAALFSAFASFVVQPIFSWLWIYDPKNWHHYYSFPIIFLIYLIGDFVMRRRSYEQLT